MIMMVVSLKTNYWSLVMPHDYVSANPCCYEFNFFQDSSHVI